MIRNIMVNFNSPFIRLNLHGPTESILADAGIFVIRDEYTDVNANGRSYSKVNINKQYYKYIKILEE